MATLQNDLATVQQAIVAELPTARGLGWLCMDKNAAQGIPSHGATDAGGAAICLAEKGSDHPPRTDGSGLPPCRIDLRFRRRTHHNWQGGADKGRKE